MHIVKGSLRDKIRYIEAIKGVQPLKGGRVSLIEGEKNTSFTVTGIWSNYNEEQIKNMMMFELQRFGAIFLTEANLVAKRNCKNRDKENFSFEAAQRRTSGII